MNNESEEVATTAAATEALSKRLGNIGWRGTWGYLGFWLIVCLIRWDEMTALPLNSLGDFLAGVFGPMAVFWLVLGYLQQGEELKQNTNALTLQVKELRASVKQQAEMVATNREIFDFDKERISSELKRTRQASQPSFDFSGSELYSSAVDITWELHIVNTGERCTRFRVYLNPKNLIPSIEVSGLPNGKSVFETTTEIEYGNTPEFLIKYIDVFGDQHTLDGFYQIINNKGLHIIKFSFLAEATSETKPPSPTAVGDLHHPA